jgi:2-polyprenyl-3-methyl-5-hydroxy-6-metoxy-1,4-benzoquinol methylase
MSLVPDRLKDFWRQCEAGEFGPERFSELEKEALDEYRALWHEALIPPGGGDLRQAFLDELQEYFSIDRALAEERCRRATKSLCETWRKSVDEANLGSIVSFYDTSEMYIYELMWWHTLEEDASPLSYVVGLNLAQSHAGRRYLDFGSGVGTGALLFAKHGFAVTQADVSSTMLAFAQWRVTKHGYEGAAIDLKTEPLPAEAYDFVTAMDVFEHLADPPGTVDALADAIRPGGCLFGRFAAKPHELRPQHIVHDFEPTFARLREHGFEEVWRDTWLWGHQLFQKSHDVRGSNPPQTQTPPF